MFQVLGATRDGAPTHGSIVGGPYADLVSAWQRAGLLSMAAREFFEASAGKTRRALFVAGDMASLQRIDIRA